MKKIIWLLLVLLLFVSACNEVKTDSPTEVSDSENEPAQTDNTEEDVQTVNEEETKEVEKEHKEEERTEQAKQLMPKYKINEETSSIVPLNDSVYEKVVLLTIDDAPDTYALEMAKTLKKLDANAIFFVNGHFLDTPEEKDILKQIHAMGFSIGNHTYSHPFLPDLSQAKQKEEIVSLSDTVEDIIGERPKFFRAPNGANTDYTKQVAKEEGMVVMNWTYGFDYFKPYMNTDKLIEAMVTGKGPEVDIPYSLLKSGANLLMHDREWTAAALDDIVAGLREKGYEMADPKSIKTLK